MTDSVDRESGGNVEEVLSGISKTWLTPIDGKDAFVTRVDEALAGLNDHRLRSAIVDAIPSAVSTETTYRDPLPINRRQYLGIRMGIAFMLAAYRHERFLGEGGIGEIIGQDAFYGNLTRMIEETTPPQANKPSDPVLGRLLTGMEKIASRRNEYDLQEARVGAVAAHQVITQMRRGA